MRMGEMKEILNNLGNVLDLKDSFFFLLMVNFFLNKWTFKENYSCYMSSKFSLSKKKLRT